MPLPQQKQKVDRTICPRRQTWVIVGVTKPIDRVKQSSPKHPRRRMCVLYSQMTELSSPPVISQRFKYHISRLTKRFSAAQLIRSEAQID